MEAPLLRVRQGGRRGALANSRRIDAMEALAASIPCANWMRQSRRPIRCLSAWPPMLFARSAHNADRLANDIEAGNLSINHFVASVAETPFAAVTALYAQRGITGVGHAMKRSKCRTTAITTTILKFRRELTRLGVG